jgi:hypothetical protein
VDGAAFQVIGTTAIGATTATNTGLSIASNYQYRIRGSSGGYFTGYSNTASASTYDANASSFVATSGATDIVAINDFVLGVKTLGLWNSMVCWPLRSSQNAGTGTTAYSLGGLGAFNGTLVNGPTWGSNGITTTSAAGSRLNTNTLNSLFFTKGTLAYAAKFETSYASAYYHYWFPGAWQFIGFTGTALVTPTLQGGSDDTLSSINSPSPPTAVFEFKSFSFGAANITGNRNGSTTGSMTRTQTPSSVSTDHTLTIGDATASMGWVFNEDLTNTQMVALYSLYKSTLGTGLSIP